VELYTEVRALARAKYGWGDGLPVEFRLQEVLQDWPQFNQQSHSALDC
jgi:hypothetical protein